MQLALIMTGAPIAAILSALIALRIAKPIGLGIEQRIQCLFDGAAHDPVEMSLGALVIDLDDIVQVAGRSFVRLRNRPILCHWWSPVRLMVAVLPTTTGPRFGAAS